MTDYKATPEQWAAIEELVSSTFCGPACLLELRARVEQLEAAAHKHIIETSSNILALASRVEVLEAFQQQPEPIDQEENDRRFHACMDLIKNATPEQIRAAAGLPERPASKVHQISKPLKLTPDQVQQALDQLRPKSKSTPNPSQIRSSLVERVHSCIVGEPECGHMQARAVIREVAAWLAENAGGTRAAWLLEREVER